VKFFSFLNMIDLKIILYTNPALAKIQKK